MPLPSSRHVLLLKQQVITTNGTGPIINVPQGYSGVIAHTHLQTVSGTSPTFNFFIQNVTIDEAAADVEPGPQSGSNRFQDFIAFNQQTTNGAAFAMALQTSNVATLQQDATLTAGTVNNGPIGDNWRVKWTVGGTSPQATVAVLAKLVPMG
jgi:hypothetical protein